MLWLHIWVKIRVVHINLYINEICNVRKHSIQPYTQQLGTWTFISKRYTCTQKDIISGFGLWVFSATFNNISVISWRSVTQYWRFFHVNENGLSAHYGRAVSGHWHLNRVHLDHGRHHTYKVSNGGQLYYYTMCHVNHFPKICCLYIFVLLCVFFICVYGRVEWVLGTCIESCYLVPMNF
jgi:hypothetical protein